MKNNIEEIEAPSKRDKGFTLVELLIVIVILGILATVTVFAVRGITDQGKESSCAADQKTLQVALESYYAQYGDDTIPTEADLVDVDLLRGQSKYLMITSTGNVAYDPGWDPATADPTVVDENPCDALVAG